MSERLGSIPQSTTAGSDALLLPIQDYGYADSAAFQEQFIQQMFPVGFSPTGDGAVRSVIQAWWLMELGFTKETSPLVANAMGAPLSDIPGFTPPDLTKAIQCFAALSPTEQRAWLEANWEALRSGELTLEDLQ